MKEFLRIKIFIHTGNIFSAISIIVVFFLTMAGGKPTRLLPRHALEKFYHEMIKTSKPTGKNMNPMANQETFQNNEPLRKLFNKQYSAFGLQENGMRTRVLIYSISSKGYLAVDGANVDGRGSKKSKNAVIIIESIGFNKVRLRGEQSRNYICFDEKGKLEGKANGNQPNCIFKQYPLSNYYTAFRSIAKQLKWVGIRPKGTIKKGTRTKRGQRATKFVILRL